MKIFPDSVNLNAYFFPNPNAMHFRILHDIQRKFIISIRFGEKEFLNVNKSKIPRNVQKFKWI